MSLSVAAGGASSSTNVSSALLSRGTCAARSYETLFWASGADWRELNLIDTSDTVAASTHNRGWGFWKGGGQSDGECAGQRIDSGNQLVLMVREPAEGASPALRVALPHTCAARRLTRVTPVRCVVDRCAPASRQRVQQQLELDQERVPGRLRAVLHHHQL